MWDYHYNAHMKISWIALMALSALIGLAAFPAAEIDWTIQLRNAGPLKIGMSIAEVRRIMQDETALLISWEDPVPDNCECAYLESAKKPKDLGLMFQNGYLVRIDVHERGIRTANGAGVGDSEERIKQLYPGQIKVEPHNTISLNGNYLIYKPSDPIDHNYGMIFETYNGAVTSFRSGTEAAIALSEGCN
jgi:hypothetical protein